MISPEIFVAGTLRVPSRLHSESADYGLTGAR